MKCWPYLKGIDVTEHGRQRLAQAVAGFVARVDILGQHRQAAVLWRRITQRHPHGAVLGCPITSEAVFHDLCAVLLSVLLSLLLSVLLSALVDVLVSVLPSVLLSILVGSLGATKLALQSI